MRATSMRAIPMQARRTSQGFTLIEVLVAVFIMSILAVMSWRGIDGMARSQEISRQRADYVATMQTALAQWQTDLDQMTGAAQYTAIDYDGRVLRITRSFAGAEIRVVGWTRRSVDGQTRWLRWQSDALKSRTDWQDAWAQATRWGQNPGNAERSNETMVASIDDWQLFYYRNDGWSNPLSTAENAPPPGPGQQPVTPVGAGLIPPPDGVRLVLTLSQGQALAGTLTRDWAQPRTGGGKS